MRKLILLRGAPGSGKTTFLARHGLTPYALSLDDLRLKLSGPVLSPGGGLMIDQAVGPDAHRELTRLLEIRMASGHTTFVDATHLRSRDFRRYPGLLERYGYQGYCLDLGLDSLEETLARNASRADYAQVSEQTVREAHALQASASARSPIREITAAELFSDVLHTPVHSLDTYDRVVHVGDLQGCFSPLVQYLGPGNALDPGTFYIFVGDYLDRGIENAEVLSFILENYQRQNVALLFGNHETHLLRYACGAPPVSDEFAERTLPQIEDAGITRRQVRALVDSLHDVFFYRYHGREVMVTHAGLSNVPACAALLPSKQMWKGTGSYTDPVDRQFTDNAPQRYYQVHGHRNARLLDIAEPGARSFNLERQVEFGGELALLELDARGFVPVTVRNRVFRAYAERVGSSRRAPWCLPEPWLADLRHEHPPQISPGMLAQLRSHELVRERPSQAYPHVSAFNFTRQAFYSRQFDAVNTRARGLFVNPQTGEIVARGYDKFFNIGEPGIAQASLERLAETLVFPLTGYLKENGFLGLLGYDAVTDELFLASKSTPEGPYAERFREIFECATSAGQRELLRRTLRDQQMCLALEVVDPECDPHIIDYPANTLVVLDAMRRSEHLERLTHPELVRFAAHMGLRAKQRLLRFEHLDQFLGWMRQADAQDFRPGGRPIEGVVFEDAEARMVKWKSPYYSFWKQCRSIKDRVLAIRGTRKPLKRDLSRFEGLGDFADWCREQPDAVLRQDIISLRARYLREHRDTAVDRPRVAPDSRSPCAALAGGESTPEASS